MFGGDKDDTKLTPFGYIVLALALPVALWMCIRSAWPGSKLPGPEVMGMGWEPGRPSTVKERSALFFGGGGNGERPRITAARLRPWHWFESSLLTG